MSENSLLKEIFRTYFVSGIQMDYEDLKKFLNDPQFPNRAEEFKTELRQTIRQSTISPQDFERLTSIDQDSQKDVNQFLTTELWKPLYPSESI